MPANAEFLTESSLLKAFETRYTIDTDDPLALNEELAEIELLSQKNAWPLGLLKTQLLRAELFVYTGNFTQAKRKYDHLTQVIDVSSTPSHYTRLLLINLNLQRAQQDVADIVRLQDALLAQLDKLNDVKLKFAVLMDVAFSKVFFNDTSEAIKLYKLAYDIANELDDNIGRSRVYSSLGNVYLIEQDIQSSLNYYKQALDIAEALNNDYGKAIMMFNLASAFQEADDFEQARHYMTQALKLNEQIKNDHGAAESLIGLANIAKAQAQWQAANSYLQRALPNIITAGNFQQIVMIYADMARNYAYLQQYSTALNYLYLSESYLPNIDDTATRAFFYATAVQVYTGLEQYRNALLYSNQMLALQQTLHEAEKKQNSQKYLAQFDSQIKESQNEQLKLENELKTLQLAEQTRQNKQRAIINSLSLALLLVLTAVIIFFVRRRNFFKNIALHDHLTNAPNRRAILEVAKARLKKARSGDITLAVCLIDLDNFKLLNDSFGHDAGDEVLKAFSNACNMTLREKDSYGRYGGEEWLMILTDANPSHIDSVFARLREALNSQSINGIPKNHHVTFSMGVAVYDATSEESMSQIINRADTKLYSAKDQGRNAYAI